MPHALDPEGGGIAQLHVHVAGDALVIAIAKARVDRAEGVELGQSGQDVDRAAGAAAAAQRRIRPANDLDRIDREHLAALRGEVADAVDIDAALAVEAANEGSVADRIAALGRAEGDAGHGAKRILQVGRSGLRDHVLRQHHDRLRRIEQRRHLLGIGGSMLEHAIDIDVVAIVRVGVVRRASESGSSCAKAGPLANAPTQDKARKAGLVTGERRAAFVCKIGPLYCRRIGYCESLALSTLLRVILHSTFRVTCAGGCDPALIEGGTAPGKTRVDHEAAVDCLRTTRSQSARARWHRPSSSEAHDRVSSGFAPVEKSA